MDIIHVMTGDLWAGAEVQLYETMSNMPSNLNATVLVVLFNNGELARRLLDKNINILVIDENDNNSIKIVSKLSRHFNSMTPIIVHVHDYKSHVLTYFALNRTNLKPVLIRTLHGLKVIPKTFKILKSYALSLIEDYLLRRRTDCIIAVSKDIEHIIKKKYPNVHVEQINNAISIPDILDEQYINQIRKNYNIKKGKIWIASASRLVSIKNLSMLIESISTINKNDRENFVVSIFGDGPLKLELANQIDQYRLNDIITLHGHNDSIINIMQAFDIFVNTSIHEGLPMSVLEAMACEVLPVCTRVGGMKEIIEHNRSGFLIDLNDTETLAKTLVNLKNDALIRERIRKSARNRIIANYNINKSIVMLNDVYESLLNNQSENYGN